MRHLLTAASVAVLAAATALAPAPSAIAAPVAPHPILQQPAISHDLVAFAYAGDIWVVPRAGGRATRLTTGVGVESAPVFSPDGQTLAFTGDYDGNVDVFTVPVGGGSPHRVTYHPGADAAVAWSADGKNIIFRTSRDAATRYTRLYSVPAAGGPATPLPLPMAYSGALSPDGGTIAYTPFAPAFSFDYTRYVAWGHYTGGTAGTVWLTDLKTLTSVQIPHEAQADFSPVFLGGKVYFLSGRDRGRIGVFVYDPVSKTVGEVWRNDSDSDVRSLATDGRSLIFDRLGELYVMDPGAAPQKLAIDVAGDMPDVRPRIQNVADQVENVAVSPTGLRLAVEAHGEILTVPVKRGGVRDITNSPGVMERSPAWSPDGQSIAYFSDADGLYELHVASQKGAGEDGPAAVRKLKISSAPAYYVDPVWSPDSRKIAFRDNALHTFVANLDTGRVTEVGTPDVFGGFSSDEHGVAWSPDSRWLAFTHTDANRLHVLQLWSAASGQVTTITDRMADAQSPAFDRNGKYLYFLASNNAGATMAGIDMTTDLYHPTSSVYALALSAETASPTAPDSDDEKTPGEAKAKAREGEDVTPAGEAAAAKKEAKAYPHASPEPAQTKPTAIDIAALPVAEIARRVIALPLPAKPYVALETGKPGVLYTLAKDDGGTRAGAGEGGVLSRWTLDDRKSETLASNVDMFHITADGEKMLLKLVAPHGPEGMGGAGGPPHLAVAPADKPWKPGDADTEVKLDGLQVRVDPPAEWAQMYREVWRIERAFFYDPNFHGVDTVAEEARLAPLAASVQSRSDLNYVFQEMLTGFSVGHLRGTGGAIPEARKVPGGLLGADYVVRDGRWCIAKIYDGGDWSPEAKAPLAQPGLHVQTGDCILAVNGQPLDAHTDIQAPLEGLAGRPTTLRIASGAAAPRDVVVVPIASESRLRYLDWIETNRRRVDQLSGGKLAYVHLPDTGEGGFTNFNRYFFAQTDKQGVVVDERFNAGGQIADYFVEVLGRQIEGYWQPRYGAVDHTPAGAIYGPKVMLANEQSGSGGDALPWLFKHNNLGPLVGKRTWGGLVGIGEIPVLMDGGHVTSPSVAFFSPAGQWEVENHGVDPDYPVEQDPKLVAAGHDPQLETAVTLALDALAKSPPPAAPPHPAFPVYKP